MIAVVVGTTSRPGAPRGPTRLEIVDDHSRLTWCCPCGVTVADRAAMVRHHDLARMLAGGLP